MPRYPSNVCRKPKRWKCRYCPAKWESLCFSDHSLYQRIYQSSFLRLLNMESICSVRCAHKWRLSLKGKAATLQSQDRYSSVPLCGRWRKMCLAIGRWCVDWKIQSHICSVCSDESDFMPFSANILCENPFEKQKQNDKIYFVRKEQESR